MREPFIVLTAILFGAPAFGADNLMRPMLDVNTNMIISATDVVDVIDTWRSVRLDVLGVVGGDIRVCDGCDLFIRNGGYIGGTIYAGTSYSNVIQVINSDNDMNKINVVGAFSILVEGKEALNLSDIIRLSNGADKIVLGDSHLIFDGDAPTPSPRLLRMASAGIELNGTVIMDVGDMPKSGELLLLSNVSGNGTLSVNVPGMDGLWAPIVTNRNGNLYLSVRRETDYRKIIGLSRGDFINNMRTRSQNDKLLAAIDGANSVNELRGIMDRSVVFNPTRLFQPIKTFNNFETANIFGAENEFSGAYIFSDDANIYSAHARGAVSIDDVDVTLSAYAGTFDFGDDINDFQGNFYGANIRAHYDEDDVWADGVIGATFAQFETDDIYNDGDITRDPNGTSVYGAMDAGLNLSFFDADVKPFVGAAGNADSVLSQNEITFAGRMGAHAKFETQTSGVKNEYGAFAIVQTNGVLHAGVRVGFKSVVDGVGGGLSAEILRDGGTLSHRFGLDVNFEF